MESRVHFVTEEELEVIRGFGCKVEDYSYLSEEGYFVRDFTIYCDGQFIGNEDSTYTEIVNNILQVRRRK